MFRQIFGPSEVEVLNIRIVSFFVAMMLVPMVCFAQDASKKTDQKVNPAFQEVLDEIEKLQPPKWEYSELAAKSDLIVVAKAISSAKIEWSDAIAGDFGKRTANCLSNKMKVLSILKGRCDVEIEVITIEWKPNAIVLTNSDFAELRSRLLLPSLVGVVKDGEITGYGGSSPIKTFPIEPEYLLYLRRHDGNTYLPVTGQRYSGLSVRVLND